MAIRLPAWPATFPTNQEVNGMPETMLEEFRNTKRWIDIDLLTCVSDHQDESSDVVDNWPIPQKDLIHH